MPQDPRPRRTLAPPFSRPTQPGLVTVISPSSEAGRPLRPTPYASAVIPHLMAATSAAEQVLPGGEADEEVVAGPATPPRRRTASLRDVPGDHAHATGVPVNPEVALESDDSTSDYPADSPWPPDAVFGWTGSDDEWEAGARESAIRASAMTSEVASAGADSAAGEGSLFEAGSTVSHDESAMVAAATLERVAAAIRSGELSLPTLSGGETDAAILASALSALLAPAQLRSGAEWRSDPTDPLADAIGERER